MLKFRVTIEKYATLNRRVNEQNIIFFDDVLLDKQSATKRRITSKNRRETPKDLKKKRRSSGQ